MRLYLYTKNKLRVWLVWKRITEYSCMDYNLQILFLVLALYMNHLVQQFLSVSIEIQRNIMSLTWMWPINGLHKFYSYHKLRFCMLLFGQYCTKNFSFLALKISHHKQKFLNKMSLICIWFILSTKAKIKLHVAYIKFGLFFQGH